MWCLLLPWLPTLYHLQVNDVLLRHTNLFLLIFFLFIFIFNVAWIGCMCRIGITSVFVWQMYPQNSEREQSCLTTGSFLSCSSDNTIRLWNTDGYSATVKRNVISNVSPTTTHSNLHYQNHSTDFKRFSWDHPAAMAWDIKFPSISLLFPL